MPPSRTLQLSANESVWYAIEDLLRYATEQADIFGDNQEFAQRNLHHLSHAITEALRNDDGTARLL